jgi:hypothetical protein
LKAATLTDRSNTYNPQRSLPPLLSVQGRLIGAGTTTDPAVITSVRDQATGTAEVPTSTVPPAAGDWVGIDTVPVAQSPVVDLDHTTIEYEDGISQAGVADVTLTNDLVEHSGGTSYYGPSAISLNAAYGGSIDVENTTVEDASGNGMLISDDGEGSPFTVENNNVIGADLTAYIFSAPDLVPSQLSGNLGSGNLLNIIEVDGGLAANLTLPMPGLPWVVGSQYTTCQSFCQEFTLTVDPGVTMTLGPDAVLKFMGEADDNWDFPRPAYLYVEGTLTSTATAARPAALTDFFDDSVGGDTNSDGAETVPVAGDWGGIVAAPVSGQAAPMIKLSHTTINYGDEVAATGVSSVVLVSDTLDNMGANAINATLAGGSLDIESSTISAPLKDGIAYTSADGSAASAPTIRNNLITGAGAAAIAVTARDIVPDQITANNGSADHPAAVVVSGTLAGPLALPAPGLGWEVAAAGEPWAALGVYDTVNGLTVPPGQSVTLGNDAVLKFDQSWRLQQPLGTPLATLDVQGSLDSTATSSDPAAFTSSADDASGGDTNGDGDGSAAEAGDWYGIVVDPVPGQPAPTVTLTNSTIEYATLALDVPSGNASITGAIIDDVAGVSGPARDASNSCSNGVVSASPVDWGTPSGPAPNGIGPSVSGCVSYQPWVGE